MTQNPCLRKCPAASVRARALALCLQSSRFHRPRSYLVPVLQPRKRGPQDSGLLTRAPYFPTCCLESEGIVKPPPPSRTGGGVGAPALVFLQGSGLVSQSGGQHGQRCLAPVTQAGAWAAGLTKEGRRAKMEPPPDRQGLAQVAPGPGGPAGQAMWSCGPNSGLRQTCRSARVTVSLRLASVVRCWLHPDFSPKAGLGHAAPYNLGPRELRASKGCLLRSAGPGQGGQSTSWGRGQPCSQAAGAGPLVPVCP